MSRFTITITDNETNEVAATKHCEACLFSMAIGETEKVTQTSAGLMGRITPWSLTHMLASAISAVAQGVEGTPLEGHGDLILLMALKDIEAQGDQAKELGKQAADSNDLAAFLASMEAGEKHE